MGGAINLRVYLDSAATTKVDKQVVKVMMPYFSEKYGNASSIHDFGGEAEEALKSSRKIIADSINAKPEEIIFTSGGTEGNNFVLKGLAFRMKEKGKDHIITTKIEHPSIVQPCKWLEKQGFKVTYLNVDSEGFVNFEELKKAITPKTFLVSIIHGNNEIGTIQDIASIGKICREKGIYFHIDACQSYLKTEIDVEKQKLDFVTLNAHKIHGPKGIGALFARKGIELYPLLDGGGQESKMRGGTENIPGIVGFSESVKIWDKSYIKYMEKLRDYLIKEVLAIGKVKLNGPKEKRLCNNANFSFYGIDGEALLLILNNKGIAVSTGSACSAKSLKGSPVLEAIGLDDLNSHGSLRLSLSRETTKKEIDYTIKELKKAVDKLRSISMIQ